MHQIVALGYLLLLQEPNRAEPLIDIEGLVPSHETMIGHKHHVRVRTGYLDHLSEVAVEDHVVFLNPFLLVPHMVFHAIRPGENDHEEIPGLLPHPLTRDPVPLL